MPNILVVVFSESRYIIVAKKDIIWRWIFGAWNIVVGMAQGEWQIVVRMAQ